MIRMFLIMVAWLYSVSAYANTIFVKVSNKVLSIKTSTEFQSVEDFSHNQLIDLLKNAESISEINIQELSSSAKLKDRANPGGWTEKKINEKDEELFNPGTWTEMKKDLSGDLQ